MNATFSLEGSMIIRSGYDKADAPDIVHLHSNRNGKPIPVLSGTSLAGALRARAFRIANTIGGEEKASELINRLFGPEIKSPADKAYSSHLITTENEITNPLSLVQQRIKIDRFTGSSFPSALFDEQPIFEQKGTNVSLSTQIQNPENAQIGLLLLLLKDLWTGDLPLGGEASIGRGRLSGLNAKLKYRESFDKQQLWEINKKNNGKIEIIGDRGRLENFVSNLLEVLQHETKDLKTEV